MTIDVDGGCVEVSLPIKPDDLRRDIHELITIRRSVVQGTSLLTDISAGRLIACSGLSEDHFYAMFAAPETGYFVDALDLLPWDLWVGMEHVESHIEVIGWVPSTYLELVSLVVGTDDFTGLRWYDSSLKVEPR